MSIQVIRGFKDILPDETPSWRTVEKTADRVLSSFGYQEIRIPILERTELFARSIGSDTDIVEKEMFTFPDRHGDLLTLRPEATAGIVRSVIENNLIDGARPLKVYFIGPMFRYERPQKGRQRQFHQLDVEAFNDPSPHMDAEIVGLLHYYLTELGLTGVVMNINSLGCPKCRPQYKERLITFLLKWKQDLCPDCQRRLGTNPLRVIDCKVPRCGELVKDAPGILDTLCQECQNHFDQVKNDLRTSGIPYTINPRLVRGLDYYMRTTFEAIAGDLGAQNAVAGGGRYDGLFETLGGPAVSGIGFAIGLERLVMLLPPASIRREDGLDLYVAALNDTAIQTLFPLIQSLRRRGLKIDTDYQSGSLKSRLKRADKANARKVLIIGPEELSSGLGILRDMNTKTQTNVPLSSDAEHLRTLLINPLLKEPTSD